MVTATKHLVNLISKLLCKSKELDRWVESGRLNKWLKYSGVGRRRVGGGGGDGKIVERKSWNDGMRKGGSEGKKEGMMERRKEADEKERRSERGEELEKEEMRGRKGMRERRDERKNEKSEGMNEGGKN